ncbi:thiol S-methyltransferase TMT1B-like [Periplaneta americana]|uniref:thiol S-methyltransferase TMT1B-like n=1 Tax=Periplaneta americana TaxID=6978 RepID=UPI0037E7ECC8
MENLFLPLHNIESKDWELRNKGLIRILEIGFRTGENIKYYPKNCHLLVVDRNVYIQSYLDSNPNLTNNVNLENVFVLSGESLKAISDNSVDAVVGTYVLCTATRVDQLLSEIKRVLTPKGLYFFLEHNPEPQNTFLHKVQNILTITKLWPIIFDGCHLNRRTEQDIKAAQFSDLTYQFITVSSDHNMFSRFIRTHVIGSAIK